MKRRYEVGEWYVATKNFKRELYKKVIPPRLYYECSPTSLPYFIRTISVDFDENTITGARGPFLYTSETTLEHLDTYYEIVTDEEQIAMLELTLL